MCSSDLNRISITALLDCGATGLFLNTKFVEHHDLNTVKLPRAVLVHNVDGTLNQVWKCVVFHS